MQEMRNVYDIFIGKPEGKIILKWILGKYGGGAVDWIHLAQDTDQWWALLNTVMKLRVP
jgi:hypothetical protein